MIRALCPVCHREHPIEFIDDGMGREAHRYRIAKHRRATRNNNERHRDWFNPGMPCEGSGMLAHKPQEA
jgi:hypothetical protein